jgi:hypothetical protein
VVVILAPVPLKDKSVTLPPTVAVNVTELPETAPEVKPVIGVPENVPKVLERVLSAAPLV